MNITDSKNKKLANKTIDLMINDIDTLISSYKATNPEIKLLYKHLSKKHIKKVASKAIRIGDTTYFPAYYLKGNLVSVNRSGVYDILLISLFFNDIDERLLLNFCEHKMTGNNEYIKRNMSTDITTDAGRLYLTNRSMVQQALGFDFASNTNSLFIFNIMRICTEIEYVLNR